MIFRTLGAPAVVLCLLLGVVPAASCVHGHRGDPAQGDRLRRHQAPGKGQGREVRAVGVARGKPMTSAANRRCLAFSYQVVHGSGKNQWTLCRGSDWGTFEVELPDQQRLAVPSSGRLPLWLSSGRDSSRSITRAPYECLGATTSDRIIEYCLEPGDDVEVWGCLDEAQTSIVPCRDGADEIQTPPAGGPLARLQEKTRHDAALAVLWLGAWCLAALAVLSRLVLSLRQGDREEQPS